MSQYIRFFGYLFFNTFVIIVNKYVLTILKFTYPAIFQGWQCLCGFMLFYILGFAHIISIDKISIQIFENTTLLPLIFCYVLMIISGSKALAAIPIPAFIGLHNFTNIGQLIIKTPRNIPYWKASLIFVHCLILIISYFMIIESSPNSNENAYYWMTAHVVFSNFYQVLSSSYFESFCSIQIQYILYFMAMILLIPSSLIIGEISQVARFDFLYFYKFQIASLCSGVTGALAYLMKNHNANASQEIYWKILTLLFSYLIYYDELSSPSLFWIFFSMIPEIIKSFCDEEQVTTLQIEKETRNI